MTGQVSDGFDIGNDGWSLVGIDGGPLFDPTEHGLTPISFETSNWRGYRCFYELVGNRLMLGGLEIGLGKEYAEKAARAVAAVAPESDENPIYPGPWLDGESPIWYEGSPEVFFSRLAIPVPFTGRLLIGQEFIQKLYVHMGYQPAWKYRLVRELEFHEGVLTRDSDVSDVYAEARRIAVEHGIRPPTKPDEVRTWIREAFDQSYGASRKPAIDGLPIRPPDG